MKYILFSLKVICYEFHWKYQFYGISLLYAITGFLTFDGVSSFMNGINNGVVEGDFTEVIFISCLFIMAGLGHPSTSLSE